MPGAAKLRMTRQRQVLLEELAKTTAHPTAEALHRAVRRRLPRISLGTVYRNLELLADRGRVHRIEAGGKQRHFDGRTDPHYHVRCVRCGAVGDLLAPRMADLERIVAQGSDWQVTDHDIRFEGVCPACRGVSTEEE